MEINLWAQLPNSKRDGVRSKSSFVLHVVQEGVLHVAREVLDKHCVEFHNILKLYSGVQLPPYHGMIPEFPASPSAFVDLCAAWEPLRLREFLISWL